MRAELRRRTVSDQLSIWRCAFAQKEGFGLLGQLPFRDSEEEGHENAREFDGRKGETGGKRRNAGSPSCDATRNGARRRRSHSTFFIMIAEASL